MWIYYSTYEVGRVVHRNGRDVNCMRLCSCDGVGDQEVQAPYLQIVRDCNTCMEIKELTGLNLAWCVGIGKSVLRLSLSSDVFTVRFVAKGGHNVHMCVNRDDNAQTFWCGRLTNGRAPGASYFG